MHYCYIIKSESLDKFYIGSCLDVEKRLKYHNSGWSRYTKAGIPWTLYYAEKLNSRTEALKKEKFFKSKKSRKYIMSLILLKNSPSVSS